MSRIRLGVIGLGLIWRRVHGPLLRRMGEQFDVVALCDTSEERRTVAAQLFPEAHLYAEAQALLADPASSKGLDAALVLTPLALNAPLAHAVLAAGKDVIMEKPIARSSAEGAALLQAARSAGKRLIVAEQFAYRPLEERLIDLLQAGAIGEIVAWDRAQHFDGDMEQGELRYDSTPWRKQADFPLGALFDGGIHRLAALSRVFGAPQHVFASGRKLRPDYGDYDYVAMLFEYQGGRVGYFSYSPCLTPLQDYYVIHGAAGVITVDANKCITLKRPGQADCLIEVAPASDHERMWQAIVQFLQHGVEPGYTAEMALRDVTILEAVERSLKSGERTHIQLATG